MAPAYYTPSELAAVSKYTKQGICKMLRRGEIPAMRKHGCWYIEASWMLPILPPDHPDRREADRQP